MFPGIQRDSDEWNRIYKIRTIVERSIKHFKTNMCIAGRKTRNHTTTKADVFLAGIASQLTVIVAYAMNCPQYIRSLKPLVPEKIFNCHNTYLGLLKYAQNLMFYVNSETFLNTDPFFLLI